MANVLKKEAFILPEGVIYLDGNSLGPMPKSVPERVAGVMNEEWAQLLIRGWIGRPQVINWFDNPPTEVMRPETIHNHPCEPRVVLRHNPFRKVNPPIITL